MAERKQCSERRLGTEDWAEAARLAGDCSSFVSDVEEEHIADEDVSCYNCRYRRWLTDGAACMAGLAVA